LSSGSSSSSGLRRDALCLELRRQRLELVLVEVVGDRRVGDVGSGQCALLVAVGEEGVEGVGDGRGHGGFSRQRTPLVRSSLLA